jgi:CheY-like chemotaxis protein
MWVLQIDDDDDDLEIFGAALRLFDPAIKYHGVLQMEAANSLFNTEACAIPDVIFLDINMPRQSGFDCYAIFKNDSRFNNTEFIFLSTFIDENAMPAGCAFMTKQNSLNGYVSMLHKQLPALLTKSIRGDNCYQFRPFTPKFDTLGFIQKSEAHVLQQTG